MLLTPLLGREGWCRVGRRLACFSSSSSLPFSFPSSCVLFLTFFIFSFKNHLLSPLHDLSTLPEPGDKMVSKISIYCPFRTFRQWKNQTGKLAITVQCNRFSIGKWVILWGLLTNMVREGDLSLLEEITSKQRTNSSFIPLL